MGRNRYCGIQIMRNTLKFFVALFVAFIVMLTFRTLVFTIYYVDNSSLKPAFTEGDHVMVNRWSYGLRTGGNSIFSYGRICRQQPEKGDFIAFIYCRLHRLAG